MELALVDCGEGRAEPRELPRYIQAVVYCGVRGSFSPPSDASLLSDFDLTAQSSPLKRYLYVENDLELGYRLSQLGSRYQLTVYTSRPGVFQPLKIHVESCVTSQLLAKRALTENLEERARKYINGLSEGQAFKEASVLAVFTNFAEGLVTSYRSRYQDCGELPRPEELASAVYDKLSAEGVFIIKPSPSTAPDLLPTICKESLSKYLERILPGLSRPQKYPQAVNTLANFLDGGINAVRTRLGSNLPDSKSLSQEIFQRLIEAKAVSLLIGKVTYDDEKIVELRGDRELQNWVATGKNDPRPPSAAAMEEAKSIANRIKSASEVCENLTVGDLLTLYTRYASGYRDRKTVLSLLFTKVYELPAGLTVTDVTEMPENCESYKVRIKETRR